jgi:hypothetical protein
VSRWLLVIALAAALTGCGTAAGERQATASVARFEAAIQAKDGAGACKELSSDTSSSLESDEKKPCEEAILGTDVKPAHGVRDVSIWVTGGQVKLDGDTLFLDDTASGWKISAAGCKLSSPDEPYDCELEG